MQPDVTVNKVLIYKFFGYLFADFFQREQAQRPNRSSILKIHHWHNAILHRMEVNL